MPADGFSEGRSSARRLYRFGDVRFDEGTLELRVGDTLRSVDAKPRALLQMLLSRPNDVFTAEELIRALWPGLHVGKGSLPTAVYNLRTALEPHGHDIVASVPRIGYRIAVEVELTFSEAPPPEVLSLAAGSRVPGRNAWVLEKRLGHDPGRETWLIRHDGTGTLRVLKFATTAARIDNLQRQAATSRVLQDQLGSRDDLTLVCDSNFESYPYYVELPYAGRNLGDYCARGLHRVAEPDERLIVVAQIAETLADAHDAGVLHGDLKPSNILLADDDSSMTLIRLTDFVANTLIGDVAGFYTAPEILKGGPPTAAADIYALGILLYQLTVGDLQRKLAPGWEEDVSDLFVRQDIAETAAGDPSRRLASARLLAERLRGIAGRRNAAEEARLRAEREAAQAWEAQQQRAENERLVRAAEIERLKAATSLQRAAHAAETERRTRLAAVGLLIMLAAALGLALRAHQQREVAVTQRQRAEQVTFITESGVAELIDGIVHRLNDNAGVRLDVLQGLLGQADATLNHLIDLAPTDVQLKRLQARGMAELAATYLHTGDLSKALDAGTRALALQQQLLAIDRNNEGLLIDFARSLRWIADVKLKRHDLPGAVAAYQSAIDTFAGIVTTDPDNADIERRLALAEDALGLAQIEQGNSQQALVTTRSAQAHLARGFTAHQDQPDWQLAMSLSDERIGDALEALNDWRGALACYQASLVLRQRLVQHDGANMTWRRDLAVAIGDIGDEQKHLKDYKGALASYEAGQLVAQQLAGDDPKNLLWQRDVVVGYDNIGDMNAALGDIAGAVNAYRSGLLMMRKVAAMSPLDVGFQTDVLTLEIDLGNALVQAGDSASALPYATNALELASAWSHDHPKDTALAKLRTASEDLIGKDRLLTRLPP